MHAWTWGTQCCTLEACTNLSKAGLSRWIQIATAAVISLCNNAQSFRSWKQSWNQLLVSLISPSARVLHPGGYFRAKLEASSLSSFYPSCHGSFPAPTEYEYDTQNYEFFFLFVHKRKKLLLKKGDEGKKMGTFKNVFNLQFYSASEKIDHYLLPVPNCGTYSHRQESRWMQRYC